MTNDQQQALAHLSLYLLAVQGTLEMFKANERAALSVMNEVGPGGEVMQMGLIYLGDVIDALETAHQALWNIVGE